MSKEYLSEAEGMDLLHQLEEILEFDTLIDEVGFIHPSQFVMLNEDAERANFSSHIQPTDGNFSSNELSGGSSNDRKSKFWNKEHKLGISTHVLLPLYKAAKYAFMTALKEYKAPCNLHDEVGNPSSAYSFYNYIESRVMRHSRSLLLLSCDFGTAWNSRKLVVSKKQDLSIFMNELYLSALVLSCSPKSEQAWNHRRWVIKSISKKISTVQEIVQKESELVEKIAERSKMNYRAWNHRRWLIFYMTGDQVLHELKKTRDWASLHIADNCCFHYRRCLMLRMLENSRCMQSSSCCSDKFEIYQVWKHELEWNEALIKRYAGREALWLHRRFLSLNWIKYFLICCCGISCHSDDLISAYKDSHAFLEHELCLLNSCLTILDDEFEDFQAQAVHSACYILWLKMEIRKHLGTELVEKLKAQELNTFLNEKCPDRSLLWDHLIDGRT